MNIGFNTHLFSWLVASSKMGLVPWPLYHPYPLFTPTLMSPLHVMNLLLFTKFMPCRRIAIVNMGYYKHLVNRYIHTCLVVQPSNQPVLCSCVSGVLYTTHLVWAVNTTSWAFRSWTDNTLLYIFGPLSSWTFWLVFSPNHHSKLCVTKSFNTYLQVDCFWLWLDILHHHIC